MLRVVRFNGCCCKFHFICGDLCGQLVCSSGVILVGDTLNRLCYEAAYGVCRSVRDVREYISIDDPAGTRICCVIVGETRAGLDILDVSDNN